METFTLFPTLPLELRLKIWRSSFLDPRNVGVEVTFKDNGFGGWKARNRTPPPPMALQTCHESRKEALKHYILSFGTAVYPATIYFNYQIDTLCFGDGIVPGQRQQGATGASDYLLNLWHGKTYGPGASHSKAQPAKTVRRVTLDVDESIYSRAYLCWDEVRRFEALEELILVTWDSEDQRVRLMSRFQDTMDVVREKHPEWVAPKTEVVSWEGLHWGCLRPGQDIAV